MQEGALSGTDPRAIRARELLEQQASELQVDPSEMRAFCERHRERMGGSSFDRVKDRVTRILRERKRKRALEELIDRLRSPYEIQGNV